MRRSATAIFVLLQGCGSGTETGNGFTQEITISAHSSDPGAYAVALPNGGGVVTEAWIIVGGMTLVRDGECGAGGGGVEMPPLGAGEQAGAGQSLSVDMDGDDFCQLVLPIGGQASIPTGAPPQLSAATAIVIIGETALATPFTIVGAAPQITLSGPAAFRLDEASGALFLGFDVATWLAGLDIDSGTQVGGRVLIDASNNATLSAQFAANLAAGIELYRDANGNGAADPGEERIASGR